ncbi:type VI secretion system protein TssA [Falsihalocynthiibacter arcticus]|uniref:type VI secretion system protein TssA n=1 Tax=Falsihalocynthiibacter arcticus TaxID=1579316 RepID=UPI000579161C|nr:type VI secretion system protein TssA [Falsihalocynthiibacter arcticus]
MNSLLVNFGDDAPSGEDLEYDAIFASLLLAVQPGEERQVGDQIIEAEAPKDAEIIEKATAVLERSHDLRAAVYLAASRVRTQGFEGLAEVTGYIRGCLEQYWESCHPQLDDEDDDDPTLRVNTILGLSDSDMMLKWIRLAPLTMSQAFGRISLRDIAISEGEATASAGAERTLDAAGISAAFQDTDSEELRLIYDSALAVLEDVRAIDGVFDEKIPGLGPDLSPLVKMVNRAVVRLGNEVGADVEEIAEEVEEGGVAPVKATSAPAGTISTRRDVENAIDRILAYYSANEPSSPVPVMLHRAKRLIGADFLTIMKDMAPDGVDNVMRVGGISDEE